MIYLDVAATTRPDYRGAVEYNEVLVNQWMNPSARTYSMLAANELETSRERIADVLYKEPHNIFFTSGSTEAANWVIQTVGGQPNSHIITSSLEHPCVYNTALAMIDRGASVHLVSNDNCGRIDLVNLADILDWCSKDPRRGNILVALAGANNEIGTIQPVGEIAELVHMYTNAYFFCDTTQLWAHGEIETSNVDFACASGHKFGAVRGAGFLYCRRPDRLKPFMYGGHQEDSRRAGTENLPAIASLAKMFKITADNQYDNMLHYNKIRERIIELADNNYKINGCGSCLPNIVSLTLQNCEANKMVAALAMDDIYVGAGSACSTGNNEPSRVLMAIGLTGNEARRTIRISFDTKIRVEDIDYVFKKIKQYEAMLGND